MKRRAEWHGDKTLRNSLQHDDVAATNEHDDQRHDLHELLQNGTLRIVDRIEDGRAGETDRCGCQFARELGGGNNECAGHADHEAHGGFGEKRGRRNAQQREVGVRARSGQQQHGEEHQQHTAQPHGHHLGRPRRSDQQQTAYAQRGQHTRCRDAGGEEIREAEIAHDVALEYGATQATIAGMPRMSCVV